MILALTRLSNASPGTARSETPFLNNKSTISTLSIRYYCHSLMVSCYTLPHSLKSVWLSNDLKLLLVLALTQLPDASLWTVRSKTSFLNNRLRILMPPPGTLIQKMATLFRNYCSYLMVLWYTLQHFLVCLAFKWYKTINDSPRTEHSETPFLNYKSKCFHMGGIIQKRVTLFRNYCPKLMLCY